MILIDKRIGSADLLAPLQAAGFDAQLVELAFGDLAFEGKGPNGTTLNVGVELKRLGDLVSSLRTGRLAGQINYTWSHAIDDANMQGAGWNIGSTYNNATFNGNYPLDKGSSTLDQRRIGRA